MRRGKRPVKVPSQEELIARFLYDAETGVFVYKRSFGARGRKGSEAGTINGAGYRQISIDGRLYLAHRLAWVYVYGSDPEHEIDHINRVRDDNRICNLREATNAQNLQNISVRKNNSSGVTGVSWSPKINRWRSRLNVGGKEFHLGTFKSRDEAIAARLSAQRRMFTHSTIGL